MLVVDTVRFSQTIMRLLLSALLTLWLAFTVVFFLLRMIPGDAIATELLQAGANQTTIDVQRAALGLDAPLLEQYRRTLLGYLRGDMGLSLLSRRPVVELLAERLGSTAALTTASWSFALLMGALLGTAAGLASTDIQRLVHIMISLALSVPFYWTATLILFVFAVRTLDNLLLPALILGYHTSGGIARVLQAEIAAVRSAGYVQAAYGRGLRVRTITLRHILRVAILPVVTVAALQAGFIFSGAVITESIFNRAGIGTLLVRAVIEQDYPVVQAIVLLSALVYVVLNALADGLQYLSDPRLRLNA